MSDDDLQQSGHLRLVLTELRFPRAVRQVRLGRVAAWRFYKDNPERRKGLRQAHSVNEMLGRAHVKPKPDSRSLAEWLAEELGRGKSTVKNILTRGHRIPVTVLKALDKRDDIKAPGILLDTLADALHRASGDPLDWERIVTEHLDGPPKPMPDSAALMALGGKVQLLCVDSQDALEALGDHGSTFDCICVDPPYGIRRRGAEAGEMPDDRMGSLWCVPMLARLIKPGRALCLWTSQGVMGKWAMAMLDAGLVVADAITWDKDSAHAKMMGDEIMLVASKGALPATFNDDIEKRWHMKTLPSNHPLRQIHASPKPPELMERVLARYTRPGESVLDAFVGTGPVGVAAVRMGRVYAGYEIEPKSLRAAKGEIKQALVDTGLLPPPSPEDRLVLVGPNNPKALRNLRHTAQEAGHEGDG